MVNKSVVLRKISHIRHALSRIKAKSKIGLDTFNNDIDSQDIVLYNLQIAIQACIDIGTHIISDEGWGIAGSFSEVFYILHDNGVINTNLTEKMISMTGLRNILIHEYEDINLVIIYNILQTNLKDIEKFIIAILEYFKLE